MKKLFLLSFTAAMFLSCADKANTISEKNDISNCFISKDYKYETLLSKADISKHIKIDESSYKMDISNTKGQYGYVDYEWKSDRPDLTKEILGQILKHPDKNRIKLTGLKFYGDDDLKLYSQESALSLFEQSYKKLSQEEYQKLVANLEKEYANNPSGLNQAKGFLEARMNLKYEPVPSLGTRAYWKWHDEYGIELVVLKEVTSFRIDSKTSGEANTSLQDAIKFAKEVLAKCGG